MTKKDLGKLQAKHKSTVLNDKIADEIKKNLTDGKLSCRAAMKIAAELKETPFEVGKTADLLNIKLNRCQLGLFGHSNEDKGFKTLKTNTTEIEKLISETVTNGKLTCIKCWDISKKTGMPKTIIAKVCENKKIKILKCQLGAFR